MDLKKDILKIEGPILIIGASGFVGANLYKSFISERSDVFGTCFTGSGWRHSNTSALIHMNICDIESVKSVIKRILPKTIMDCSSFGAYSFEKSNSLIHKTNYNSLIESMKI